MGALLLGPAVVVQTAARPNTKVRVRPCGSLPRMVQNLVQAAPLQAPRQAISSGQWGLVRADTGPKLERKGTAMNRVAMLLTAAAAAMGASVAAGAQTLDLPARKPGLWDMKTVTEAPPGIPGLSTQMCIDAATDKEMMNFGLKLSKDSCKRYDIKRAGKAWVIDADCNFGPVKSTTKTTVSGRLPVEHRAAHRGHLGGHTGHQGPAADRHHADGEVGERLRQRHEARRHGAARRAAG